MISNQLNSRRLRRALLMLGMIAAIPLASKAQLAAGDVVIVGWNSTDNSTNVPGNGYSDDDIDFLLLTNITAGTDIYFTDFGWTASGFQTNEFSTVPCATGTGAVSDGCIKWTAATNISAGTQVRIGVKFGLVASTGTVTSVNRSAGSPGGPGNFPHMSLSTGSDQIYAFTGSLASPTLIAGVQYGAAFIPTIPACSTTSTQSVDPGVALNGYAFVYNNTNDNAYYSGTLTAGTPAAVRTAVLNTTNWTGQTGPGVYTLPIPTTFAVGTTWQGTTTNWFTTSNWSCTCTPTSTDNVVIPAGASAYPDLSTGTASVNNITISSGASLSVTGTGVLQIAGTISNNGTFTASSGGITFNGSSAQTISGNAFNGGTANTIEDLVISNTSGVSISSALNIAATGSLTVNSGSTLTTGGNLTLLSTSAGTARVANSAGTITGNVTWQRYIPGGRRTFRFLSHPLTTTQPLSVLTDDIDITGTGGSLNGFTTTATNNPSAFWYDQSTGNGSTSNDPGWTAYTNTNGAGANGWQKGKGLRVLVRGTIGQGLNGAAYTPSPVTLDMTGTLNQGSQVINVTKGSGNIYYFTGNPFPSQINMNQVSRGTGIGASYFTFDPNFATKGAYINRSWLSNYNLPAGAGFIAILSSSSTLTFSESCKSTGTPGTIFKTTNGQNNLLLRLYSNNDSITWDQLEFNFDNTTAHDSDYYDGPKMFNPELSMYSFSNDNHKLSIDTRPYVDGQVIPMGIVNAPELHYTLKVEEINLPAGAAIYLHDKYLGTTQQLLAGGAYSFDVTADTLSQGDNRFELGMQGVPASVPQVNTSTAQMKLMPNPTSGNVQISFRGIDGKDVSLRITDITGNQVYFTNAQVVNSTVDVDMKNLPAGLYFVELRSGTNKLTQKLIKQ